MGEVAEGLLDPSAAEVDVGLNHADGLFGEEVARVLALLEPAYHGRPLPFVLERAYRVPLLGPGLSAAAGWFLEGLQGHIELGLSRTEIRHHLDVPVLFQDQHPPWRNAPLFEKVERSSSNCGRPVRPEKSSSK